MGRLKLLKNDCDSTEVCQLSKVSTPFLGERSTEGQ